MSNKSSKIHLKSKHFIIKSANQTDDVYSNNRIVSASTYSIEHDILHATISLLFCLVHLKLNFCLILCWRIDMTPSTLTLVISLIILQKADAGDMSSVAKNESTAAVSLSSVSNISLTE